MCVCLLGLSFEGVLCFFFRVFKHFFVGVNVLVANTFVLCFQCFEVSLIEVKIVLKSS